jgi:hypothetical protein
VSVDEFVKVRGTPLPEAERQRIDENVRRAAYHISSPLWKRYPNPLGRRPRRQHLTGFDKALHQLELTSVRTRARAEAIIARGETYFDEWKEQLSGITNRAVA